MSGKTFVTLLTHEINAFTTADDYVYLNRGLLNYVANEAQLVSVLAHELGHITENTSQDAGRGRRGPHGWLERSPAARTCTGRHGLCELLDQGTAATTNSRPTRRPASW
jgi:hypothetical protein